MIKKTRIRFPCRVGPKDFELVFTAYLLGVQHENDSVEKCKIKSVRLLCSLGNAHNSPPLLNGLAIVSLIRIP